MDGRHCAGPARDLRPVILALLALGWAPTMYAEGTATASIVPCESPPAM